ncbi:MAG: substrate-binding domain-containing protein [Chloroflexi bacterium]|nr:substrate-binding domain-containing protein [Chloroflexota bacterium]MBU1749062.1 substrate-binding domain-containing protein [Chloroflexota bacterium]
MRTWINKLGLILVVLGLLSSLTACDPSPSSQPTPEGQLRGTVTVSGAWALYPLMVQWSEEFQKLHPDVRFDISAGGAGKGMADALSGAVDIGMVSRAIYQEEVDKGAFGLPVVKDAVFCTISDKNPVWDDLRQTGLNQETITGIYVTGEITTWGQVVGRPEVTDPIHVFTRSDACGAADTWAAYLGKKQEDLKGIGVYGDPGVLEAVIKDPLGVGYNNLNYAFDAETGQPVAGARVVPLDVNGNNQADPEEACDTKAQAVNAVATNHYPSPPARDLNLVTKGQPTGLVKAFLAWVLTDGQRYVDEAGYIALPKAKLDAALSQLD